MNVRLRYFAVLRERAGIASEVVETAAPTYRDLYREVSVRRSLGLADDLVRVAVNGEFADMDERLEDGAEIVFIPPVAGG